MNTPIADFVRAYARSGTSRLHMPGHKGSGPLGCERFDLTEISGADALYEADGIIAKSEANAASLFGSGRTLYSTEGSSQCIRAMLHLAVTLRRPEAKRMVIAARNVHKAFIHAAALIDFDVTWLYPEESSSLCACPVSPFALEEMLSSLGAPPAAVYVTSPDYLGGMQDIRALAQVCRRHGVPLLVDNAHGAYLRFCSPSLHPLDLGADMCCDSAHKTLPVLTGGAYLHIASDAPQAFAVNAKSAMALYGSTSPSYLTLCSLDLCNAALEGDYPQRIAKTAEALASLCVQLREAGWRVSHAEPLKLTLHAGESGVHAGELADRLREGGVECEFADTQDLVLMATPHSTQADFDRVLAAIGRPGRQPLARAALPRRGKQVMSIRDAVFARHETLPIEKAVGRVCASPAVSCPPAIPIAVSGEIITEETAACFALYGIGTADVVLEEDSL